MTMDQAVLVTVIEMIRQDVDFTKVAWEDITEAAKQLRYEAKYGVIDE